MFERYIGVDVSKNTLDICVFDGKEKYSRNSTGNNFEEIKKWIKTIIVENTIIVIESTGDYHILFCILAKEKGLDIRLINPIITKQFALSMVRKQKSDKVDSKILTNIAFLKHNELQKFNLSKQEILLKKKISVIGTMSQKIQALNCALNSMIELHKTLDIKEDKSIQDFKENIKSLKKTLTVLEFEIVKHFQKDGDVERISKVSGISVKSASKLKLYLNGKVFNDAKQVVAFSGLDVSRKESGSSIHTNGKLSKRGDPNLRKLLFGLSWGLIMHNPPFKELYDYHRKSGKHYFTCMQIISRKVLKIVYAMLRDGSEYNPSLLSVTTK